MIMTELLSTIYQYIAPAHRAIWRFGILFWIPIFYVVAAIPGDRTLLGVLTLLTPYCLFEIAHVVSEYNHPIRNGLGLSGPDKARGNFLLIAIGGSALWFIFARHHLNEWPWLALALSVTGLAYLIRPRLPHPLNLTMSKL